jgi:pimeloyl-ACP methyl ester carboxylesterase
MPAEERQHRVRDIEVRMLRAGTGARLLFLHGAAGVPPWNSFFDELAARYEVLLPEHPGFGTDKYAAAVRNIADLAMYYLDFLDGLDGAPVHLIGHSLGGWLAAEIAVRNCSRISTLTLIAPAGLRITGIPAGDNFIWSPEELTRNLFHDQSFAERQLSRSLSEEESDRLLTNRFMAARLAWEPRWFNPALEKWLHRIRVPALLLWGENDKLLPCAYASLWAERVARLQVVRIPECGHLPQVEKADLAASAILAFLKGRL